MGQFRKSERPPTRLPQAYANRPQTYLKHRAQREYARSWAMKLASNGGRLWYVDPFSGPWNSEDDERRDTSAFIGLTSLVEARTSWAGRGKTPLGNSRREGSRLVCEP